MHVLAGDKSSIACIAMSDQIAKLEQNIHDLSIACRPAVQAGAAHVYAVEKSSIAERAQEIVQRNGLAAKITILQQKMEDVVLPHKVCRAGCAAAAQAAAPGPLQAPGWLQWQACHGVKSRRGCMAGCRPACPVTEFDLALSAGLRVSSKPGRLDCWGVWWLYRRQLDTALCRWT